MFLRPDIDWKTVAATAKAMGVKAGSLKAWKRRGYIPHKWRFPLTQKVAGLHMQDFAEKTKAQ